MNKKNSNVYTFKNILRMSDLIFAVGLVMVALLAILSIFTRKYSIFEAVFYGLDSTVLLAEPFLFLLAIILMALNIFMLFMPGKKKQNIFYIFFGTLIIFLIIVRTDVYESFRLMGSVFFYPFVAINGLINVFIWYHISGLIATMYWTNNACKMKVNYHVDYLIVLGCGLRRDGSPTKILKQRIDKAIEFAKKQEKETGHKMFYIASGGQGYDEIQPEAMAIKSYMLDQGVPPEKIIIEEMSTNTYENFKYCRDIVNNLTPDRIPNVAFCTTNFHVFRSKVLADKLGLNAFGIGSKTWKPYWFNAVVQEYYSIRKGMKLLPKT